MEKALTYEEMMKILHDDGKVDFETSFSLAKTCEKFLSNEETEDQGRDITIRALDVLERMPRTIHHLWWDLVEAAGLYPYIRNKKLSNSALLRYEFHRSKYLKDIYLHSEQMKLSLMLDKGESIIVSAPTSFGKSLLIEELVASRKYRNIVIIQPTLALLDETRKKLQKYTDTYYIVVSTSQKNIGERNIFLFTGERVVEYQFFPKIDFFVIDEFYKLSLKRDEERAASLNHALYRLLKMTDDFYMLGPNIKRISKGFTEQYGAKWVHSNFATVAADVFNVFKSFPVKKEEKEQRLFKLLTDMQEPTLIYCSSPSKVNKISKNYLNYLDLKDKKLQGEVKSRNRELIEWIDENVHPDWSLRRALGYSIGCHHGALPRHLSSSIVDSFNKGEIKYLFSTSTLIEGVNTSAKNVVLFDEKKGPKPIDYFDFKNISGRAGRMSRHFVGRVFKFNPDPEQFEFDVDIPLFSQDDAPLELLVQLENKDLSVASVNRLKEFDKFDEATKKVIRANKGIPIEGQMQLLSLLRLNAKDYLPLLTWRSFPNFQQLNTVLDLGLRYLLKKGESHSYTSKQLAFFTLNYTRFKSLKALINMNSKNDYWIQRIPDEYERLQQVIQDVLQIARHWLEYKLPKILVAVSNLQLLAFSKYQISPGDYTFFASQIENDFVPSHLTLLLEYGVPSSAIRKLSKVLKEDLPSEQIIEKIKTLNLDKIDLLDYEKRKLKSLFLHRD